MKIYLILTLIVLVSCKEPLKKDENSKEAGILVKIDDTETEYYLSNIVKSVEYIKLEYNEESALGGIDKIIISNDKIYVLDMNNRRGVFCFDMNGKFLSSISKQGKGPGELLYPSDFDVKNGIIYILETNRQLIQRFKLDGTYIDQIKLNFLMKNICVFDDIIAFTPTYRLWDPDINYNLVYLADDFSVKKKYFRIPEYLGDINYSTQYWLTKSENNIFYKMTYDDNIFVLNKDEPVKKYTLDISATTDFNYISNKNNTLLQYLQSNSKLHSIDNILEIQHYLFFRYSKYNIIKYFFYDSKTKHNYNGKLTNDVDGIPFPTAFTSYDNKLFGAINPYFIIQANESPNYKYKTKKLKIMANQINEFTNYVIAAYSLK